MHAAPAVSVRSTGTGVWRLSGVLLPALATCAVCAWALAHAQQAVWPALALIPGVSVLLWLLVRPQTFDFLWDGERWLTVGPDSVEHEGRVEVMLDLGPWLLLRWHPVGLSRGRRWIPVPASQALPNLHALRAAVYCRRPEPTPGTRAAPHGRQAAEPD